MGYIRLKLNVPDIDAAFARAKEVGILEGSHRKEAANLVGSIGEIVFKSCMEQHGVTVQDLTDRTDMDFRLNGRFTVDVKTKDRTVFPKADYDNSIPLYNHKHQRPDYFFFISLVRDSKADVNDPYGADDWSDSGHHDYQYEVGRVVEALSKTLLSHFSDWIRGLPIPAASSLNVAALPLAAQARYLSFNYTDTLQKTYGIPNKNIVHIHGVAVNPNSNLILGHGYELPNKDPYR